MMFCGKCTEDDDRLDINIKGVGNIEFCLCGKVTAINEIYRNQITNFEKLKNVLGVNKGMELMCAIMDHNQGIYTNNGIKKRVNKFMFNQGEWTH